jgi:hypothetical protein
LLLNCYQRREKGLLSQRIAIFVGAGLASRGDIPPKLRGDFFAFESSLRNGSFVAADDSTGDGIAKIVIGGGPRGAPRSATSTARPCRPLAVSIHHNGDHAECRIITGLPVALP